MVEIGCAFGASPALLLSSKAPGVHFHSIDPFGVDSMADFQAIEAACRNNVRLVLEAVDKVPHLSDWTLYTNFSYNVVEGWSDPIDMLFVDGDHLYEAVRRDYTDWLPWVREGGVILFHNSRKEPGTPEETFNRGWVGPTGVAEELEDDTRVERIDEAFSITVWRKVGE